MHKLKRQTNLPPGDYNIKQIAALPYRNEGTGIDAPVSILLITSRETKRWVIPKGNIPSGKAKHYAAAEEAEEEAGVRGSVCPTPLGRYQYRKRKSSGAALMFEVDVYPLAVTQELANWKEKDERTRKWFSLADAADAVEEEDLRDLIRSFGFSEFNLAAQRYGVMDSLAEKSKVKNMFAWFQRLLPKTGNFFELFEAHASSIVAAADATGRLLQGGSNGQEHVREIIEREHDADNITREVLKTVRETFLTPFDRGAIVGLIGAMDDVVDEMQAAASAIDLYQVTEFEQDMQDMAAIIVDSARLTSEAIPLLRDVAANSERLHELTERIIRMEGHADDIHISGLKRNFQTNGKKDTLKFIVVREIFKHLERVIDAFEDIADEIDGIVVDHA